MPPGTVQVAPAAFRSDGPTPDEASRIADTGPVDILNLPLFASAALGFASVLAGLYSARIGCSFLLVFLFAGLLGGENWPG